MKTHLQLAGIALAFVLPMGAFAQQNSAKIHGKVNNPAGSIITSGDVKFTTDKTSKAEDRKYAYDFPIDASGNYKGDMLAAGDYVAIVFVKDTPEAPARSIDFQNIILKNGDDKTLDFDMSRAEYLKSLKPEELAAIEANKKRNAAAMEANVKIGKINAVLVQARADEKTGKAEAAITALTPFTTALPDEPLVWAALGEAQLALADDASKAARAAHQPATDPALMQKYADSVASYQKAIDLEKTAKKPSPETTASCYLSLGQGLSREGKMDDAAAAYEAAVKTNPASAPIAYFDEAASFFNAQKMDEASAAADKAIAADPKRAEAYYIKAQSLVGKATMDPKTNKFILPPGCLEAYQQYLELQPTGGHSQDVKDLLSNLGQAQKSGFKSGKK